jgi:hypothetical protein
MLKLETNDADINPQRATDEEHDMQVTIIEAAMKNAGLNNVRVEFGGCCQRE